MHNNHTDETIRLEWRRDVITNFRFSGLESIFLSGHIEKVDNSFSSINRIDKQI